MIRSYVCRQCRSRFSQPTVTGRNLQWRSKASFISLRNSQAQSGPEQQHQSTEGETEGIQAQNHEQGTPLIRYSWGSTDPQAGRYSRRLQDAEEPPPQQLSLSSDSARRNDFEDSQWEDPGSGSFPVARNVEACLKQNALKDAWKLVTKHYTSRDCPALTNPSLNDIPLLNNGSTYWVLCTRIATQFCRGSDLPPPTAVLFKFEQLGLAPPAMWQGTIGYVTDQLLWSLSGATKKGRHTENILFELMSLWRLLFQCKAPTNDALEAISPDWNSITKVESLSRLPNDTNFGARFKRFHPEVPPSPTLQFSAITLFNIFTEVDQEKFKVPDLLREQNMPFIELLTRLLPQADVSVAIKHTEHSTAFKALPEEFRNAVVDQISSAPSQAMKLVGSQPRNGQSESDGSTGQVLTEEEMAANLQEFYLKRIARAIISQSSVDLLEKLWEEVLGAYTSKTKTTSIPPYIYNAFLSGFMALDRSDRTIDIWNHMVAHGIKPEPRTWNALLEGCVKARDLNGLNAVWDRMLKNGVEPDNYAWTSRVNGLMSLRQTNLAFGALDEMGKRWLSAENAIKNRSARGRGNKSLPANAKVVNNCTKPSIEVINGAVSAIVQMRRRTRFEEKVQWMHKVLQWAGDFDIKPDVRTYNILIQLYLNAGDTATTFKLLRQMEHEGLQGDLSTHTMLIRAAFDNQKFNELTESEQCDRILAIFSELETGGLKLNAVLYSSIVDRLLKYYSNYTAARVVIDHMMARNLSPSPQIYTSLATFYFEQSPPNIEAVDSLLLQVFGPPRRPTDKIFFDRVIRGYAVNGETGKMMSVLTRMSTHGMLPGWQALAAIVKAYVDNGDWERAREVVRDVQKGEGVANAGITGGWNFFSFVRSLDQRLMEPLAGDFMSRPALMDNAAGSEQVDELSDPELDTMVEPEAREMYAQRDQEMEDEYVNAEHASYLSDDAEPHYQQQQQWKPSDNGAVGGIPL